MNAPVGCLGTIVILVSGATLWWVVFGVLDVPLCKGHWAGKQYVCDQPIDVTPKKD
jgi:hypothetical protein